MSIADRVIAIIAEQAMLERGDVTERDSLAELGIDSLSLVEVIFAIEETFDINVPFNANEPSAGDFNIETVGAIIAGVQRLVAEQS